VDRTLSNEEAALLAEYQREQRAGEGK
jgi:hypothetical protein